MSYEIRNPVIFISIKKLILCCLRPSKSKSSEFNWSHFTDFFSTQLSSIHLSELNKLSNLNHLLPKIGELHSNVMVLRMIVNYEWWKKHNFVKWKLEKKIATIYCTAQFINNWKVNNYTFCLKQVRSAHAI